MLNFLHSYLKAGKVLVLLTALCLSFSINASGNIWGLLGKDFTGTIIDYETKEPIEGAYVMAFYMVVRSGPEATVAQCVKTAGMFTGKDGKYQFPIKELNGLSPRVAAIKPDYLLVRTQVPKTWNESPWLLASYQGWNIHLEKRNPNNPKRGMNYFPYCGYAETKEDAAASVQFLKLLAIEDKKYRPEETGLIDDINERLNKLENLPLVKK